MQFLGNLGVDIWLLIAQIINFSVLLWLLSKFVYRPIIVRIEKDEQSLAQVRTERVTLDAKSELLDKKEQQQLARSKKRARAIIEEAEEIATEITQRAHRESQQEKEAVVSQIKQRLVELEYGNTK